MNESIDNIFADKIEKYKETDKSKSTYEQMKTIPVLVKGNLGLKEVGSTALRISIFNLDNAYQNLFWNFVHLI